MAEIGTVYIMHIIFKLQYSIQYNTALPKQLYGMLIINQLISTITTCMAEIGTVYIMHIIWKTRSI